ncbi:hypothetical protein ACFL2L_00070 [Patescibacteria group bacterium]
MDDTVFNILKRLNLEYIAPVSLSDFEYPELIEAKKDRNAGEYCWTCKPSFMLYILKEDKNIKFISYIDTDCFFYHSPELIYKELGYNSILLTAHNFPHYKKYLKVNGLYNAGFFLAKNDTIGLSCLEWWKKKCNEWCYIIPNKERMGDQRYLEKIPKLFNKVAISQHKGINAAPWNLREDNVKKFKNQIYIKNEPLIFYHYFNFKIFPFSYFLSPCPWSHYIKTSKKQKYIYKKYIQSLYNSLNEIRKIDKKFSYGLTPRPDFKTHIKEIFFPKFKCIIKSYFNKI